MIDYRYGLRQTNGNNRDRQTEKIMSLREFCDICIAVLYIFFI